MTKPRTNQIAAFFKLEYLKDRETDFHNFLYGGSVEWLDEQNKYVIIVISW